jgi:hypothetical protein
MAFDLMLCVMQRRAQNLFGNIRHGEILGDLRGGGYLGFLIEKRTLAAPGMDSPDPEVFVQPKPSR